MQPSAGPDHPHTRTRPAHWLAVATALALTIGTGALIQPSSASATTEETTATPLDPGAPDPAAARYPLACPDVPAQVIDRASADLEGDGRPDTVAVVRCGTAAGTPPSGMYVLSTGPVPGSPPRIVATLLNPDQGLSVSGFEVRGRTVSATLLGYSSPSVPRCCPDRMRQFTWDWNDGQFLTVPGPHLGSV